jgi:hypothetical protein
MESFHSFARCLALAALLLTSTGRGEAPAPCPRPYRLDIDLPAWRQQVLKAGGDRKELTRLLEAGGFDFDALQCLEGGKVVAVDIFPATFGPKPDADRIVQIRTQRCIIERELVVLTALSERTWCQAQGELNKGGSSHGCAFEPPIFQLVHLTAPRRHTLRMLTSHGGGATADSGEKICARYRLISFWDVEDHTLVRRLEVPEGPVKLSGKFPRVVRALDDNRKMRTYRFDGQVYQPDPR